MHPIHFALKRGHWSAVAVAKKVPRMTPARFDMLYALRLPNIGMPMFAPQDTWSIKARGRAYHNRLGMKQT